MTNMSSTAKPHVVLGTYTTKSGFTTQKSLGYFDSREAAEACAAGISPGTWVSPAGKVWEFSEILVRPMAWL